MSDIGQTVRAKALVELEHLRRARERTAKEPAGVVGARLLYGQVVKFTPSEKAAALAHYDQMIAVLENNIDRL